MAIFSGLFQSPEVKELLTILGGIHREWTTACPANTGMATVAPELEALINRNSKEISNTIREFKQMNGNPRIWVLSHIGNVAGDILQSGKYELYPGVQNPLSPAPSLIELYCWSYDELAHLGAADDEFAKSQRVCLLQSIDFRYRLRNSDIHTNPPGEKAAKLNLINIIQGKTPEGVRVNNGSVGETAQNAYAWIRAFTLFDTAQLNSQLHDYLQMERHRKLSDEYALKQLFLFVFGGMLKTLQGEDRVKYAIELATRIAKEGTQSILSEEWERIERRSAVYWPYNA